MLDDSLNIKIPRITLLYFLLKVYSIYFTTELKLLFRYEKQQIHPLTVLVTPAYNGIGTVP
jgi:hypothetical protein